MVQSLLTDDRVCQDIINRLQIESDLLRSVISGNEHWIFEYEQKKHPLWKSPMSPRPKKKKRHSVRSQSHIDYVL